QLRDHEGKEAHNHRVAIDCQKARKAFRLAQGVCRRTTAPKTKGQINSPCTERSFLVTMKKRPTGDEFTVAELQGVAGVNIAIQVARAVRIHLNDDNEDNPLDEEVPPLEDINELQGELQGEPPVPNENNDDEVPPPGPVTPTRRPEQPPGPHEENDDEVPLPNPVTPTRRAEKTQGPSDTDSDSEPSLQQDEQTDASSENTSDLTTDSEEGEDRSFLPPKGSETEESTSSESEQPTSSENSPQIEQGGRDKATSRRRSRRSKANARKSPKTRSKRKTKRPEKNASSEQCPEHSSNEDHPVASSPILILSSESSGEEAETVSPETDPRPDHVGEIRDYVGRTRHNANRTPNRGRRRMKLQGVTLLADSVTLRDHTAVSDEEILPERYVPVRFRLWEDQSTTFPTLTLPTTEFMNAHQKALVNIIRGCETVLTALHGIQPDPEILVERLTEYYDQNYVKVPSSVRNLFQLAREVGTYGKQDFNKRPTIMIYHSCFTRFVP
ncbi:unnamed protein product, partial [Oikopleura dioica]